jgi:hypothetical protein
MTIDHTDEHPLELLAEYVDGTLGPDARAEVERHLAGCDRCPEEVAMARRARAALEGLQDVPVPVGLGLPARREARTARGWRVVVVGRELFTSGGGEAGLTGAPQPAQEDQAEFGGDGQDANRVAGPNEELAAGVAASEIQYNLVEQDYTAAELVDLGRRLRDRANQALAAGFPPTADAFFEDFDFEALSPEVRRADRCVQKEVPPGQPVVPFLIQGASFEGEPVYIAAFLQGPAPSAPYDRLLIWVVDRDTCALRYYASHAL